MNVTERGDTTSRWLPLLRRLTEASEDWAVWKNAEAGLTGAGDVDFLAVRAEWPRLQEEFVRSALQEGAGPVLACRHLPGALLLVALDSADPWLQLDVRDRITFRGSTIFRASEAADLLRLDERGFRRLRPGSEGLVKLAASGIAVGGRPKPAGLRKERVLELLEEDPEGAVLAAHLFGRAGQALLRGAHAAGRGGWDRRAMAIVEARAAARSVIEPRVAAGQAWVRRVKATCPVLRTGIRNRRRIDGDPERWLKMAAPGHEVFGWKTPR